ncbi:Methyltransferase type 12 [Cellulomonas flavigena DSM 20109]|uniref:Small RNA 2'-O-methyltransferase n=1 Tax=Cellulomonas flavigena (strain ATCC 482 / DSM 20109 / BCRC 11376 / JCM 18109 / NBRC 3775 / NCIMB 8073 / NRS 134) TaxID=446466 RepID=D5ULQ8_CELFN|nr:3' terminal RNA ribose 2'-O-methyltransferase Hen1 [Cellulomonas flavigena]ADG76014.1 Methyltransferase type 12 [Cellulomonas flavigena DSM 20109]
MFLQLSVTGPDATDLGFLLHKHPGRVQQFGQSFGVAHVVYPEATDERCTVALLLEVDPVGLVRGGSRGAPRDVAFSLAQYVNDRPYAASSMLAVALGKVFRTAMAGRCELRPELPARRWDVEVHVPAVPCRGGAEAAVRLFAPLGWQVDARPVPLDPTVPAWGDSRYVDLRLTGTQRIADVLSHLYVLLPTLDASKHYWVGTDEVAKLVRAGEGWLAGHPAREEIARRYLAHRNSLATSALERLAEVDDTRPEDVEADAAEDAALETADTAAPDTAAPGDASPRVPLARQRLDAVVTQLKAAGARSVVDLGCGEGALLSELLRDPTFERLLGVDVSARALTTAARRLHLDTLPDRQRQRIELAHSSVTYRDARVAGFDAAVLMEVIEHVDLPRLAALERAVLGEAAPATLVVTTPNAEHNVRYPTLAAGTMRHHDHRFEWTRAQFADWAHGAAARHGYDVTLLPVGEEDPEVGPPTQMAVLTRTTATTPEGAAR